MFQKDVTKTENIKVELKIPYLMKQNGWRNVSDYCSRKQKMGKVTKNLFYLLKKKIYQKYFEILVTRTKKNKK